MIHPCQYLSSCQSRCHCNPQGTDPRRIPYKATLQTESRTTVEPFLAQKAWFSIPRSKHTKGMGGSHPQPLYPHQHNLALVLEHTRKGKNWKNTMPVSFLFFFFFVSVFFWAEFAITLHKGWLHFFAFIQNQAQRRTHSSTLCAWEANKGHGLYFLSRLGTWTIDMWRSS